MAINSRQKGKRIERWFATELREFFPDIRRNAGTQAQSGGVDLENTPGFSIEIKGGKAYKSKMIRDIIEQTQEEGNRGDLKLALVKPDREESYAIMPFKDFKKLLRRLSNKTDNLTDLP